MFDEGQAMVGKPEQDTLHCTKGEGEKPTEAFIHILESVAMRCVAVHYLTTSGGSQPRPGVPRMVRGKWQGC